MNIDKIEHESDNTNMEHLSSYQLKKYEDVISKIEEEHKKHNELTEEMRILDDKFIASGLTLKEDLIKKKVVKVLVKIMFSIFDVYEQLFDKISSFEIEKLLSCTGSRYYFVEIYISKFFQDKIVQKKWLVNIIIKNSQFQVSKSISLTKKVTNPICTIVPFKDSIEEAEVDAYLAWPGENTWPCLKIATIPIDISYHFHLHSDKKIKDTFYFKIMNLPKLYSLEPVTSKLPILTCKLACRTDFDNFLKILMKNSYHNWDPRENSCFSRTDYIATAKTSTGFGNPVSIELNVATNSIAIHGNVQELFYLKKYLETEFSQETYEVNKDIVKNMKALAEILDNFNNDVNRLVNIYNELNNMVM